MSTTDTTRRFTLGETVRIPKEKCPCCGNHHGITDWTGTVKEHVPDGQQSNLFGDQPGPFYLVGMEDGNLVYAERELAPVDSSGGDAP